MTAGVKQYHQNSRVFSSSSINMTTSTSVDTGDDSLKRAFVKIHGQKTIFVDVANCVHNDT